jgi:signal transduction histidine kinase
MTTRSQMNSSEDGLWAEPLYEQRRIAATEYVSNGGGTWSGGLRFESLANLAHELRTPVQVLLGYLDILRSERSEGAMDKERGWSEQAIIERMNVNAHELAQTVDNVLEFVLTYANADHLLAEEIDLGQLFGEIDEILRGSKRNQRLTHRINLDDAPRTVVMRRRPLRSIVLNLASNALKFTNDGEVTILVTCGERPPTLCIEVRDTGAGMSEELLSSAFEPLVQLSNTSVRQHRGLGLGLTLVDFNVRSLGGQLQVESQPGVGSCFKVSIPCSGSAS